MSTARIKKRIVILGGSGFVGRHLVGRLIAAGHHVIVLSRNPNAHPDRLLPPGVQVLTRDVYDPAALQAAFSGADVIINLVGILNEAGDNGRGFRRAHIELTKLVIAACQLTNVKRLLQMSSLNAGRGESYYLKSRGEAEVAVKNSNLAWTIFEPSVIFGPGDGLFHRFASLLKIAPLGLPLARASSKFAPVYFGDVVTAFTAAIDDPQTIGQVYELYGPEVFTLKQIVQMTAKQLELSRIVIPLPDPLARIQALICDFIPGKPFSSDNYRSLKTDSVGAIDGLHRLDITPTPVNAILPDIIEDQASKQARMDRYRMRHI